MGRLVKIILQPITFRKMDHVAVLCPETTTVDEIIREMEGAEWSTGYHFWHMPLKKDTVKFITTSLKGIGTIEKSAFKDFKFKESTKPEVKRIRKKNKVLKPTQEQLNKIDHFCKLCLTKGYSEGTVKVYRSLLNIFFGYFNSKSDSDITNSNIEHFLTEYFHKNNLSSNYERLMYYTLRRYYAFSENDQISYFNNYLK